MSVQHDNRLQRLRHNATRRKELRVRPGRETGPSGEGGAAPGQAGQNGVHLSRDEIDALGPVAG